MAARSDIRAGRAYVSLYVKRSQFMRGLRDARQKLQSFGSEAMATGRSMVTASGAMLLPLALGARKFAEFDDAMRQVRAVTGSTEAEFERLTQTAKELGRTTSFTAVQVAGLMGELGRAGFSAGEIDSMTGSVLNLARATGTEAPAAAGIMAASLRQFGLEAEQSGRVADVLAATANKSFTTLESLGESLKYAGPVARDFNLSIEDTAALLGGLGNVGIQGTNAGTAVRRLLTVTGAEAEKLQGIFGVAFKDAAGDARPLVDVMSEVDEATKDLGSAERAKKFNEAFGLLGITGASAISRSTGDIKELAEALRNAEGEAARTAEEMDAGLGGSFRKFMSALEGVQIALGESTQGPLQEVVDGGTALLGTMTAIIEENGEAIASFGRWALILGGVGAALFAVGAAASFGAFAIGGLIGIISTISGAFGLLVSIAGGLAAVFSSPVTLVVALIAGLAAEFLRATGALEVMVEKGVSLFGRLKNIASDTFGTIWSRLMAGDLQGAGEAAMTGLQLAIATGLQSITSMFSGVWGDTLATFASQLMGGDFAGIWGTVVSGMSSLWFEFTNGITQTFVAMASSVVDTWRTMVDEITNYLLQKAGQSDFFSAMFEKFSGVNVAAELEREAQLRGQAAQMGLDSGSSDLFNDVRGGTYEDPAVKAAAEAMQESLLAMSRENAEKAAEAAQGFDERVGGGQNRLDDTVANLERDLGRMKVAADFAKKRAEAEGANRGGEGEDGSGKSLGITGKGSVRIASFNAAAIIAQSQSTPQERLAARQAKAAEEQLKKTDTLVEAFWVFNDTLQAAWPKHG